MTSIPGVITAPAVMHDLPDLRLGYVPLTDAAPLLVAESKGFFRRHGLRVALDPAASWAALRDRVALGVWDGGQMLSPMPIAASLGLSGVPATWQVTATMGRAGNTLVLGGALADALGDAPFPLAPAAFAAALATLRASGAAAPCLAVVFPFSSHNYLLRHFLAAGGVDPDHDVRLVVLAPPALPEALASGRIDGFCAGEPWGSRAVDLRVGRIALTSAAIWPDHPEKVLAINAATGSARAIAATAAVIEAAAWLAFPENTAEAAHILHSQALPGVPEEIVALALAGRLKLGPDGASVAMPRVIVHGAGETIPDPAEAEWFLGAMRRWGHAPADAALPDNLWRPDLWRRAVAATGLSLPEFAAPPLPLAPFPRSSTP
jgi:NitT/TauT family transport system ATP-binding protein/nitrate/nitrite transport system substrate-binding protein